MELKTNERVKFYEFGHKYLLDGGKVLKGVTTLLKDHGLSPQEYGSIDEETLKKAAARGTAVHKMCEAYDNKEAVATPDAEYNGEVVISGADLQKNLKAYSKLALPVLASEFLVSDNICVASSIDKVIGTDKDGEVILGDIKTSSSIHRETYSWQLSIYAYLLEHQQPEIKVVGLEVIHIRDGKAKLAPMDRIADEEVEALLEAERNGAIYIPATAGETLELTAEQTRDLAVAANLALDFKAAEEKVKALKESIYEMMLEKGIDSLPLEGMEIKLKRPYTTERFDSAAFKKAHPELASEYTKTAETKGSITIKLL